MRENMNDYLLEPIGWIRSELKKTKDAPRFYTEGAPNARLELDARVWDGMDGIKVGDDIVVITWLHLADRRILKVHPRGDLTRAKRGVFSARSKQLTARLWWTSSASSTCRLTISCGALSPRSSWSRVPSLPAGIPVSHFGLSFASSRGSRYPPYVPGGNGCEFR